MKNQLSVTGTRPISTPPIMAEPTSIPRIRAMAIGPGCGTINPCVIAPALQMTRMYIT
jgi:hypothetical protein